MKCASKKIKTIAENNLPIPLFVLSRLINFWVYFEDFADFKIDIILEALKTRVRREILKSLIKALERPAISMNK